MTNEEIARTIVNLVSAVTGLCSVKGGEGTKVAKGIDLLLDKIELLASMID